jgi:hypothetical protein
MTQPEINQSIENSFNDLSILNQQACDYWYSELIDEYDNKIEEMWNEYNLSLMKTDIMCNS